MNPSPLKGTIMYFADVVNPFGASAFDAPTSAPVKPTKLPRQQSKVVRALKAPTPPSTIIKNILLTW